jgi:hypothetical protein
MTDGENVLQALQHGIVSEAGADPSGADSPGADDGVDLSALVSWLRRRQVVVGGVLLIIAQLAWKAHDVHHLYFYQDDYVNLDRALESPLNWHFLTLFDDGHVFPAVRVLTWVLARTSLYGWGLDTTLLLVLLACSCLAALRLLRTLFGDRPAILIPLVIYLMIPLTVPDLGWWWSGIESVPLQLAMFMALTEHVLYVRTERARHLAAASIWLVVGMAFFEKGAVVPVLLFAVTAGFLMGNGSWLTGAVRTLRQHSKAWLIYATLTLGYLVFFIVAYREQGTRLSTPTSTGDALTFAGVLLRKDLLTGAIGGPWRWLPAPSKVYALAAPPSLGVWLATIVAIIVIAASIWNRPKAWRAWAIVLGWVVLADMLPVFLGRLHAGYAVIFGLETRYLADASCVLAICVGLAFLPVAGASRSAASATVTRREAASAFPGWRYAVAALMTVFIVGSIISVQQYERTTSGAGAAVTFMANARHAISHAAPGTSVVDQPVPDTMVNFIFGPYANESHVIGDMDRGKLRWIAKPHGTIDGLQMFGSDGRLYPALISGVYSVQRKQTGFKGCWPEKNGQITVWFPRRTSAFDPTLKLSYIWGSSPGSIYVEYGGTEEQVAVQHGAHAAYLPVSGDVLSFIVTGLGGNGLCIGQAEAGRLVPF